MDNKPTITRSEMKKKATSSYISPKGKSAPSRAGRRVLQTLTEDLPVVMSNEERQETGEQLAAQWGELSNAESRAIEVKAELTARRKAIEARIKSLSLQLSHGSKMKPMTIVVEADFDNGVALYLRQDSGETVRSRPLAESERQEKMPFVSDDAPISDAENPFLESPDA